MSFSLIPSFSVPAGTQKWSVDVGEQVSSTPLVNASGTSFFAADKSFYAYNASGQQIAQIDLVNDVTAPAAMDGDLIYVGDSAGNLLRIDTTRLGETGYEPDLISVSGQQFEYNAPAIDCNGDVYIVGRNRQLYRIAAGSNSATPIGSPADYPDDSTQAARYASPVITASHVITGSQRGIKIMSKSNDSVATFIPTETCTASGCSSSITNLDRAINSQAAVGPDGSIFAVSETGTLYKVDPATGTQSAGWTNRFVGDADAGPVIGSDGTVYIASENGILKALDPDSGAQLFEIGLGNVVEFSTPAIGVGSDGKDIIFVGTEGGTLFAFNGYNDGAGNAGVERFRKELEAPIRSSITLHSDGTVFAGTLDGRLYTVFGDSVGLPTSGWPKAQGNAFGNGQKPGLVCPP